MLVLLDMGADLHFRDAKGRTPLHTASTAGKVRAAAASRVAPRRAPRHRRSQPRGSPEAPDGSGTAHRGQGFVVTGGV